MHTYVSEAKLTACDNITTVWVVLPKSGFFKKQMKNAPSAFAVLSHWVERKINHLLNSPHPFLPGDSQFFFLWGLAGMKAPPGLCYLSCLEWCHPVLATYTIRTSGNLIVGIWLCKKLSGWYVWVKQFFRSDNIQNHSGVFYWLELFQLVLNIC